MSLKTVFRNLRSVSLFAVPLSLGAMIGQLTIVWESLAGSVPESLCALIAGLAGGTWLGIRISQGLVPPGLAHAESSETRTKGHTAIQSLLSGVLSAAALIFVWILPSLLSTSISAGTRPAMHWQLPDVLAYTIAALTILIVTAVWQTWYRVHRRLAHGIDNSDAADCRPFAGWTAAACGAALLLVHSSFTVPLAATVSGLFVCSVVAVHLSCHAGVTEKRAAPQETMPSPGTSPAVITSDQSQALPPMLIPFVRWTCGLGFGIAAAGALEMLTWLMPASLPVVLLTAVATAVLLRLLTTQWILRLVPAG
ncbi:MAG: hypothetical protein KDA96_24930, partial [Planctomycetaceae bacterium]|nr:hypothetical protein [Planctomycetaceae bacterium]